MMPARPDQTDEAAAPRAAQGVMARALRAALARLPPMVALDAGLQPKGERPSLGGAWGSSAALACGVLAAGRGRSVAIAPTAEAADALLLDLVAGATLDREALIEALARAGLARTHLVASPGEFSVRGDILDIYPWAAD